MFSAEEMPRLSELVCDKSANKKRDREENARTPATSPPQQMLVTPASSGTEKTGAPKEKGVAFKEPVPPNQPKPTVPSGDKGKGKLVETPPPKKHKPTLVSDPMQVVPHKPTSSRPKAEFTQRLSLDEKAGSRGLSMALEAMKKIANAMNIVIGEVWDRLNTEEVPSLLDLGVCTQAVVSLISVRFFVRVCFVVFFYIPLIRYLFAELSGLLTPSRGHGP